MADTTPTVTVVITTYNRRSEIGRCLELVLAQDYPCEVLLIDDASPDDTADYVRKNFPTVRVDRSEKNLGLIGQRTRAASLATGDVLLSIDDDVEMTDPGVIRAVAEAFDAPDIGGVTFPSIQRAHNDLVLSEPPSKDRRWAAGTYIGCAHALRKDVFLELGAYDARLYRQGEEADFLVRMYNAGYVMAMADAPAVLHNESPRRRKWIEFYYGARNDLLFCWWRVPMSHLPLYLAVRTLNRLRAGVRYGFLWSTIRGLVAANVWGLTRWSDRRPVRASRFRVYEKLRRHGPRPLDEVREWLKS